MADNKTIIIDLDNSLYAHAFTDDQQIHQEDLDKAMDIIRRQLQESDAPQADRHRDLAYKQCRYRASP